MAVYAIGDLHLSFQTNKPMDVFSSEWTNYEQTLMNNWQNIVTSQDTVIIPGDFSWAMYLEEAVEDFSYLSRLNGKKILLKGNHDYWWETKKKMTGFLQSNNFSNIDFLYNNSFEIEDVNFCGTKGYDLKEADQKIINREISRFSISYQSIKNKDKKTIAVFHYPPEKELEYMMKEYGIEQCIFGHLHGLKSESYQNEGHTLVSADYVRFNPVKII
ncbi:MAG: metallophosphoesterase [Clostridia bacterium]|jgi:predicted phosphohydrolase|nr:metallophosphoesterase [Clostridia bacterium]MDD3094267.1 metallophosphoesterase [Clostridia bacterium]MDD3972065.1 metallophosphoesterase [Clostridia bacterium]MDD4543826.1 metallophosphoesterase [Clostridia bacterium]